MYKLISKKTMAAPATPPRFSSDYQLFTFFSFESDGALHLRMDDPRIVAEWRARQRGEVEVGMLSEPLLYESIYEIVRDPALPRTISIHPTSPDGVFFDQSNQAGESRFISASEAGGAINIKHYAVGLEYEKDMIIFNEFWRLPMIERAAGAGFNAFRNHIHFFPFLMTSYPLENVTRAAPMGVFDNEEDKIIACYRTLENAIVHSMSDSIHPRRGFFALVIHSSDQALVEKTLAYVKEKNLASWPEKIDSVVVYDGWTGKLSRWTVTYPGVTSGKAYLINLAFKEQDHQEFEKQPLHAASAGADLSRFVLEQAVLDTYFGLYANPLASTEEIFLPTFVKEEA